MDSELTLEDINALLNKAQPQTVRRVLPKDFIERFLRKHLQEIQTMMDSFNAVLTFPTDERRLPELVKQKIERQLCHDLDQSQEKIQTEVDDLLQKVAQQQLLQSSIMLNVVAKRPFPFCLLNSISFEWRKKEFIPCYVILWAQHEKSQEPIKLWLELAPRYAEHWKYLPAHIRRSKVQYLRFPMGQIDFYAFNTVVSVILHNLPTEAEATLMGKSRQQIMQDLVNLREKLVRKKGQKGNFLHLTWRHHQVSTTGLLPIQEVSFS